MIWVVTCAALLASLTAVGLIVYWQRDKRARRNYRDAAFLAVGVMWGLMALSRYLAHAPERWLMWFSVALAAATPVTIWDARRRDARDDAAQRRD